MIKTALGENALKVVGMTTKGLEYYINLADSAAAEFERIDPNLKEALLWVKTIKQHRMPQINNL